MSALLPYGSALDQHASAWVRQSRDLPTSVASCVIWFDSSDAGTIHATSGAVDSWDNKGSYGGSATGATTHRPTTGTRFENGTPTLDFSGSQYMDMPSTCYGLPSGPHTLLIACRSDEAAGSTTVRSIHGGNNASSQFAYGAILSQGSAANKINWWLAGTTSSVTHAALDTTGVIITGNRSKVALDNQAYFNGQGYTADHATTAALTLTAWRIGAAPNGSNPFKGAILEIIGFNRCLTLDEFQQVEGYLAYKWGSQVFYAGHPYYGKNPKNWQRPRNIVCHGDSLVEGGYLTSPSTNSWPAQLQLFFPDRKVVNKGHGGYPTGSTGTTGQAAPANITAQWTLDEDYKDAINIIDGGRNNVTDTTTMTDVNLSIADMKAICDYHLNNGLPFLFFGMMHDAAVTTEYITNTDPAGRRVQVDTYNATMQGYYPANYVDIDGFLIEEGGPNKLWVNNSNYGHRLMPPGINFAGPHFNEKVTPRIAAIFRDEILRRGW